MGWREFWDREDVPIYVNDRHKLLHYRLIAEDIRRFIRRPDAAILDYGCGEALSADAVAASCAHLTLSDASAHVRGKLRQRYEGRPAIAVLAPEEVMALPPESFDLVVVNSLIQYLGLPELEALLQGLRTTLKPGGELVIGDVIPPATSPLQDIQALLGFAIRGGFLPAALLGLVRTALSDYTQLRQKVGLLRLDESAMLAMLAAAGYAAHRSARNIGHNQGRMTFIATPAAPRLLP